MELIKDTIRLRTAKEEDVEILNQWWNDGAVMAHAGFPNGLGESLEDTKKNIERSRLHPFSELLIIEIDGTRVGEANFEIKEHVAYPGWKICETSYQNRGYGMRIITLLFDFLFSNTEFAIEKIQWDTLLENERAQYVYEEKFKARKINVIENAFVDQVGRQRTAVEYEMTKQEFYERMGQE
ncbi:MAG: GNAT family protein [Tissierellia bacterium]|nr:GNAT family protein [Tissierellia bacterium]